MKDSMPRRDWSFEDRLLEIHEKMANNHEECMSSIWTLFEEVTTLRRKLEGLKEKSNNRKRVKSRNSRRGR
jgi:hypothetical protein